MAISELKNITTEDQVINKLQENIKFVFSQMDKDYQDGILLKEIKNASGKLIPIVIGTSTTKVPHGLGRSYLGWQLIDISGDARVWRDATLNTGLAENSKDLFLALKASTSVTISLWVF